MDKKNISGWKGVLGAAAVIGAITGLTICAIRSRAAWLESKDFCDEDDDWECSCGCHCDCDSSVPPEEPVSDSPDPVASEDSDTPSVPEGDDEDFEQV